MRNGNSLYGRLFSAIEADRKDAAAGCDALIRADVSDVLSSYFVLAGKVRVKIGFECGGYTVRIEARAERLKPAGVLPERGA